MQDPSSGWHQQSPGVIFGEGQQKATGGEWTGEGAWDGGQCESGERVETRKVGGGRTRDLGHGEVGAVYIRTLRRVVLNPTVVLT